jgi:hypothetical protein
MKTKTTKTMMRSLVVEGLWMWMLLKRHYLLIQPPRFRRLLMIPTTSTYNNKAFHVSLFSF